MKPNFDLNNKVAVITGGGGALGSCIAQSLSQSGVKIAILESYRGIRSTNGRPHRKRGRNGNWLCSQCTV